MRDGFHTLDDKLIFSNTETNKKDYASKKLNYPLEAGDLSAYDKLMSTLYSETERQKIEWAVGSVVCGESKKLQKFMVLYGAAGTVSSIPFIKPNPRISLIKLVSSSSFDNLVPRYAAISRTLDNI